MPLQKTVSGYRTVVSLTWSLSLRLFPYTLLTVSYSFVCKAATLSINYFVKEIRENCAVLLVCTLLGTAM